MTDTQDTSPVEEIGLGRAVITSKLVFVGPVTGGGTGGPGFVEKQIDFDRRVRVSFFRDDRSGSKRSGSCSWQLEADALYAIGNVAISSRDTDSFYVSTAGGLAKQLSRDEYLEEKARRWPLAAQLAVEAAEQHRIDEQARIVREAAEAERRRIENEALKELNAERAAQIAELGQPESDLPKLSGTPKQIAYALSIRDAYAAKNPGDAALKRGKTAKYWIENHRSALYP